MKRALWHLYFYGAFASMTITTVHGGSTPFVMFMGLGSWGAIAGTVIARVMP